MTRCQPILGNILILSLLSITGLCVQASCASHGEEPGPSQQVPSSPALTPSQPKDSASTPEVALSPDAMTPIDAGLVAAATSNSLDAALSSGVHFVLGDWSGSLSERRVRSTLRQIYKRLLACANKHDGYGSYEISYRLNNSSEKAPKQRRTPSQQPVARRTPKRWVYPIEVHAMQASSDRAVQCINNALTHQHHYMRIYKRARVSGTLSIVK